MVTESFLAYAAIAAALVVLWIGIKILKKVMMTLVFLAVCLIIGAIIYFKFM